MLLSQLFAAVLFVSGFGAGGARRCYASASGALSEWLGCRRHSVCVSVAVLGVVWRWRSGCFCLVAVLMEVHGSGVVGSHGGSRAAVLVRCFLILQW